MGDTVNFSCWMGSHDASYGGVLGEQVKCSKSARSSGRPTRHGANNTMSSELLVPWRVTVSGPICNDSQNWVDRWVATVWAQWAVTAWRLGALPTLDERMR